MLNVPKAPAKGFDVGFGIRTDVGRAGVLGSAGEFGWRGVYHSTYWVDPKERITGVYMAQLTPAGSIDDHGTLRTLIYQALH